MLGSISRLSVALRRLRVGPGAIVNLLSDDIAVTTVFTLGVKVPVPSMIDTLAPIQRPEVLDTERT